MATPISYTIGAVFLITLIQLGGCQASRMTVLNDITWKGETILCTGEANTIRPDETKTDFHTGIAKIMGFRFRTRIYPQNQVKSSSEMSVDSGDLAAQIEADDLVDNRNPDVVIGNRLKVGDTFTFQSGSWKILQMGLYGVTVRGDRICRSGFMHIKQISP